ncbi:MAG: adenylate/guanylate cyclase domain-containing protein, partial [Pseudomonadota bacterium]
MKHDAATSREDANRIDDAYAAEAKLRAPIVFRVRTASLTAVALLLFVLTPWPETLYFVSLLIGFVLLGWLQYELGKARSGPVLPMLFIALDMALLTFTLIYPGPFADRFDAPPQYGLNFGGFVYLFLLVGGVSISLSPLLILWAGVCAAVSWSVGILWLATLPGAVVIAPVGGDANFDPQAALDRVLSPSAVDLGVQLQNVVVMLIVAGALSAGAQASRRLLIRETAQARRVANLSRYLPAQTVTALGARDDPFGGEAEREASILFTDIVGFSAIAERLPPRETLALLRRTHALVEREVFAHGGAIDKFMGDGVMATFGAYRASETDAGQAVACVAAILKAVDEANAASLAGSPHVRISIGLHRGPVLVGDIGSERRMEFAVIGDAVNVASRLENMTRELGVRAAISEDVYDAA